MNYQITRVLKIGAMFIVSQFFLISNLQAGNICQPIMTAEVVCDSDTGLYVVSYTATSWNGIAGVPESRENSQIDIMINKVLVESGAFTAPDYALSNNLPIPIDVGPGESFAIGARAIADWGDGNSGGQTTIISLTVPTDECGVQATGRMTGGGSQIRVDGVRVTKGLTLHCDLVLSNNLEINWNGNKFHIEEHLTTLSCSDDPDIIQAPPEAPFDTLIGVASGSYNNHTGYTGEFTLVDGGEPGDMDMAGFKVYETANPANVVLDVPLQYIDGGNLQAHYDQPHK